MKKILLISNYNPVDDARPGRILKCLEGSFSLSVAGVGDFDMREVEYFSFERYLPKGIMARLAETGRLVFRNYEGHLLHGNMLDLEERLLKNDYDLIICCDLVLLPLAFRIKRNARIMFDAREFYPENFSDRPIWRLLVRPMNRYLCERYLARCDKVLTVNESIAAEYDRQYGVRPEVIMSFPNRCDLKPNKIDGRTIRIVYHGGVGKSRRAENMIEAMDLLGDGRYRLQLMLVSSDKAYLGRLKAMASARKNVEIVPPVRLGEIVPSINAYDIGLCFFEPRNFNLKYSLPNKLFEYIQARLAVIVGPYPEMRKVVERYGCGVVLDDFEPETLARCLEGLTEDGVMHYKRRSHEAAGELCAEKNCPKILDIISGMLGQI